MAAPLYKVTDEKGNVTFTDKPPIDGKAGDSKPIEQKTTNVLESQPGQDFQKSFEHNRAKTKERRQTAWGAYDQALHDAQQKLKSAQQAQKDGEEMKEGDMIATTVRNHKGGTSRRTLHVSEEYLERQKALKRAVKEAEAELAAVKNRKPMLRRN